MYVVRLTLHGSNCSDSKKVRTPDGGVVVVDGSGGSGRGSGAGRVIDAEWRDL